jgi:undecaprenyl diphosphate synthase
VSEPAPTAGSEASDGIRQFPRHVAIIMDGNGRWAKARGLPRAIGHKEGVEALRRTVDACGEIGVRHLTVFSFSTENWTRPQSEIDALFDLLRLFIKRDLARLHREGVCIRVIGAREGLSADILALIDEAVSLTRNNTRLCLNIAFNYGGRAEIVAAARRLAEDVAAGQIEPADIDEAMLASRMWTAASPEPDLLIRTSGEFRISNFLLWSGAYTELMFMDIWWPDFDRQCLETAIDAFRRRDRRFGGIRS